MALALVGLEVFYLVAMNVFLSTPLFGKIVNADPDVIDVHYARAWSLFPTRIHAESLSIRATDSHVEWILRLDEVSFDCPLRDLARKLFHVTRARGQGISFRLRMKVPPSTPPDETRWLPPIDSLGPVGVIPSGGPYAGTWSDKDWSLFTIHLEDIVAEHVHEIWIDSGRFEGDARIAGGFYLKPIRAVNVGPARVEIRSGRASLEGATVMDPLTANADFLLERFDPRIVTPDALAHLVSLSMDATTAIPDVSAVAPLQQAATRVAGRVDVPKLALRIVRGVIRDGTHIDARAERLDASMASHSLSAAAAITADVAADRLSAHGEVTDLTTDVGVSVNRVAVSADSAQLDLGEPLQDLHGTADIDRAEARDASRSFGLFLEHAPVRIARGDVRASAHLEAWRQGMHGRGEVQVHASGVDALVDKRLHARGALDASASVGSFEYEPRRASEIRLDVRAERLGLAYEARRLLLDLHAHAHAEGADLRRGTCSRSELRVDGAHVTVSKEGGAAEVSIAHVSVGAASPHLVVSDPLRQLQVVGSLEGGRLSVGALQDLFSGGNVTLTATDDARFAGDAAAEIRGHVARGAASVRTQGVGFAAKKIQATGNVAATANVERWDLANDVLTGDVAVTVTDAHGGFGASAAGDAFVSDRIDAHVSATSLDVAHARPRDLDYELRMARARLPDARALNGFLPSPAIVAIESGSAVLAADIDTRRSSEHGYDGDIQAFLYGAKVRFHETHLGGNVMVDLKARAAEGSEEAENVFELEGSQVVMRDVRISDSAEDTSAWSGDLVLQEGRLVLAPTPRLSGNLTLHARDASPLLAVLLRGTLPDLIVPLTRMPELTVSTDFVAGPDELVVTNLIASGGNLSLLGTYALSGGQRHGAFVVQKGPFSAGIRMDDQGAHLRLFDLNRWYSDQRREIRGALP